MKHCDPEKLLESACIRATRKKVAILGGLIERNIPICARDLHVSLNGTVSIDLVTVYRTLAALTEAGIVREISDASGTLLYEMACRHNPSHPHFMCTECRKIECLPALDTDTTGLLSPAIGDREVREVSITVSGICEECRREAR